MNIHILLSQFFIVCVYITSKLTTLHWTSQKGSSSLREAIPFPVVTSCLLFFAPPPPAHLLTTTPSRAPNHSPKEVRAPSDEESAKSDIKLG